MSKTSILLLSFFTLLSCTNRTNTDSINNFECCIDSVFIFTTSIDGIFTSTNVSKNDFYCFFQNCSQHKAELILDRNEILTLTDILNTLQPCENSDSLYHDFEYKPVVSNAHNETNIYLVNNSILDIRALIIIVDKNKYKPIWVSNTYVEMNKNFYYNNDVLRNYIKKYEIIVR